MNIYYWGEALQKNGPVADLLKHYFLNDGGFWIAILIAVFVALFGSLIFYGVMGRKFALSTKKMWWVMLVLTCLISFGLSALSTGTLTGEKSNIGIVKTFNTIKSGIDAGKKPGCIICSKYKNKEDREKFEQTVKGLQTSSREKGSNKSSKDKLKGDNYLTFSGNPVAQSVSLMNIVWSFLLYLLFSMFFKLPKLKITKFAYFIPCRWPNGKSNNN